MEFQPKRENVDQPPATESKPKRRGRPPKNQGRKPVQGRLPIWKRRSMFLRKSGTTPRDVLNHDWTYVKKSAEVERNCRFLWMSDIMWQKHLPLPGFVWDIWQPVDQQFIDETGIETPYARTRTPEGTPRCGDAFLMWAPEEQARECDKWKEERNLRTRMKQAEAEFHKEAGGIDNAGPMGSVEVSESDSIEDPSHTAKAAQERSAVGSALE